MTSRPRNLFLTLLHNELGVGQANRWELCLALGFFYLPWLALNIGMHAVGEDLTALHPGPASMGFFLWLMGACFLVAGTQVPVVFAANNSFKAFEFLFTRAVDRRLNFRAKALAVVLLVVVPQVPGWLLAAGLGDTIVTFDNTRSSPPSTQPVNNIQGSAFPTARYLAAFPGSERLEPEKSGGRERFRIRHGWMFHAAWVTWVTLVLMTFLFAYYALLGGRLKQAGWWANTLLLAPLFCFSGIIAFLVWRGMNPGDEIFLFFRLHWLTCWIGLLLLAAASLRWCEHQFCSLEVE